MPTFNALSNAIRFLSIDAVNKAKSGHPGMPMGMADIMTVLYRDFLRYNPEQPNWPARDRFVLSNGHGSTLLYSTLHLCGYNISLDDIKDFRTLNSKTAGHPEYGHCDGVETTTGPLGQGVANAVGMAIAQKKLQATHGDIMHYKIYASVGDGCLMEGISHEACEIAGAQKLDNLILLFDDNNICIDGEVTLTSATDITARFESYGFNVLSADGHNEAEIHNALSKAQNSDKPVLIRFKTRIGYGSPAMENTSKAHGSPLGVDERAAAAEKLGWTHGEFEVPQDIYNAWKSFADKNKEDYNAWVKETKGKDLRPWGEHVDLTSTFKALKKEASENPKDLATRKASGVVLEAVSHTMKDTPFLVSGSADLTGSVNTLTKDMTALTQENPNGNYLHYGVREHAMGAIMNGLSLSGFIPLSGTFLAFADYMKPAMRLSSLMNLQAVYVITHDSIGLGEDGPTHQPVEQLSMLRAMPNFNTFRPCDLVEAVECWQMALSTFNTPSGMVMSRQTLPALRTTYTEENLSAKGAYVIHKEADTSKPLDTVLLSSGSEVHLAVNAAKELTNLGKNIRVLSVPCVDLFLQQDPMYQAALLPAGVKRVAVEAAARQSWDRFLNDNDIFIGMDNGSASIFGASAPAEDLYKHFNITVENIVNHLK